MLHESENSPVRKENEVELQRAEMRMVRWLHNVKVRDRVPIKQLRETRTVSCQRLRPSRNYYYCVGRLMTKLQVSLHNNTCDTQLAVKIFKYSSISNY